MAQLKQQEQGGLRELNCESPTKIADVKQVSKGSKGSVGSLRYEVIHLQVSLGTGSGITATGLSIVSRSTSSVWLVSITSLELANLCGTTGIL